MTRATPSATPRARTADPVDVPAALVWIDSREAVIVRLKDGAPDIQRIESEVPAHHRATGHVRHDPSIRHGGGREQSAGDPHRLEHLAAFLREVVGHLPADGDLVVMGPGTVREQLERRLRAADEVAHAPSRRIEGVKSGRLTRRQLVAELRRRSGQRLRRSTVGAYRWDGPAEKVASGHRVFKPRRVSDKQGRDDRRVAARDQPETG